MVVASAKLPKFSPRAIDFSFRRWRPFWFHWRVAALYYHAHLRLGEARSIHEGAIKGRRQFLKGSREIFHPVLSVATIL